MKIEQVKELRIKTGAGIMDCRAALEECADDMEAAEALIREKRSSQSVETSVVTDAGIIHSYIHSGERVGVLVEVSCGTDFAARTDEFKTFVHELALHVAAMNPPMISPEDASWDGSEDAETDSERYLLLQPFIKDPSKTIGEMLAELSNRIGEPCAVRRLVRWEVGEEIVQEKPPLLDKSRGFLSIAAFIILVALVVTFGLMLFA